MNPAPPLAVVPALAAPMQALLAILPALALALLGAVAALFRPATMKKALVVLWRVKTTLVPVMGVVVAVVWLAPRALPRRAEVTAPRQADYDWPTFGRCLGRSQAAPGTESPMQGGLVWRFDDAPTFYSSPAVVGNRVYVVSAEKGIYVDRGYVYCLDALTGELVWKTRPDGMRATFSSPAVVGDRLLVGEGLHWTTDARLFCLDISDEGRGRIVWKYEVEGHVESSPAVADGRVYVGAGDHDGYYCFELEPGEDGEAQLVWHVPGERYPDAETPPAVYDGRVFVGLGFGGDALVCLDAETGDEIWRLDTPFPVLSAPTVAEGRVYFGMGNANYVFPAEEVARQKIRKLQDAGAGPEKIAEARERLRPGGEVWGVDIENPENRWRLRTDRSVLGAVTAAPEGLYFGTWGGKVHHVSPEGEQIASWNAHAPVLASPAYTDELVYIVTNNGRLHGLRRSTLEPVWEAALGTGDLFISSPAVAHGHVYVGTARDGFVCVGQPAAEAPAPWWKGLPSATLHAEPLPEIGSFLWNWPVTAGGAEEPTSVTAPAAWEEGRLLVPVADGPAPGLACLQEEPDEPDPVLHWTFETPLGVHSAPAAGDGKVFFVDGRPGDEGRHLFCLDAADGREIWRVPVGPDAAGTMALFREGVFLRNEPNSLSWYDLEGELQWSTSAAGAVHEPARAGDILVVALRESAALLALDAPTGRALWRVELDAEPTAPPRAAPEGIYVGTAEGLDLRCLVDGSRLRVIEGTAVATPPALDRVHVAYVNADSELVIVRRDGGEEVARRPGALPQPPAWVHGALLYATEDGLQRHRPGEGTDELWLDASWLGRITSPPVVIGPQVYFSTDERGFVCAGEW